jgi:cytochrome c oxidase cbb3-type subunit I
MDQQEGYADDIVKSFIIWSLVWGSVAVLLGVLISFQIAFPQLNVPPYLSYGRLRPIHTNAGIFGWGIGSFMAFFYYITQRLTKTRIWSPALARVNLWLFNLAIALAAITLALGMNRTKEYAELEWPVALLVVVVWVMLSVNIIMTVIKRREEHMYISLWYILATLVGVAVLYLVNNAGIPVSLTKSYPVYAGANDANVQWWYGHNAVAMVLTTPPLAIFYYFLPKSTGNPIFSHKMGVIAFWSLIFMYLWTGAHHLLWAPVPDWVQTLAMAFSVMLIAPSWAAVFNGYYSMKDQWHQMRENYLAKFLIFSITFYGTQTLQGPSQSIRTFSAFIHFTDWVPGHVHMGALGWVSLTLFAAIYYTIPRLYHTEIYSIRLANIHFWLAVAGQLIFSFSMWIAGVQQAAMLNATNPDGSLHYSFMETLIELYPYWYIRAFGGVVYLVSLAVFIYNIYKTIGSAKNRPVAQPA